MFLFAAGNPFINAYLQSDWFGKGIFWALFLLSGISWTVILRKSITLFQVRRLSAQFSSLFSEMDPLGLQYKGAFKSFFPRIPNPYFEIYKSFKSRALSMIGKTHLVFTQADRDLLEAELFAAASKQLTILEKHLFILPTVVTLSPFIGLLGTVWGILISFSNMQGKTVSGGSDAMLAGISLALAATVIGLTVAIPALIGNSYLKNALRELQRDTEGFLHLLLTSVELRYQREDHAAETASLS